MYNILKRPMFKMGGQADQGSGIMSYVEPRQNYMFGNIAQPLTPTQQTYSNIVQQNPYTGYAIGGRVSYAQAGPVQVPDPFNYFAPNKNLPGTLSSENEMLKRTIEFDKAQKAIQQKNREDFGILTLTEKRPVNDEEATIKRLISEGYFGTDVRGNIITTPTAFQKQKALEKVKRQEEGNADMKFGLDKESGDFATGIGEQKTMVKKPISKEAITTDPRLEIRKEADMLKDLLKDEGLTTAENAFIIAKALSTPGGFNAKVAAAANLAMPIAKERGKLDRDAVLKAYETNKEIKKAEIAAGKKDPSSQLESDILANKIRQAQSIPGNVITGEDGVTRYKTPGSDKFRTADEIQSEVQTIRVMGSKFVSEATNQIRELQDGIEKERLLTKPNEQKIEKALRQIKTLEKQLQGGFKSGGRVKKQFGGMMDTTEENTEKEVEENNQIVDTNVTGTPMKPVQKLSYEEIRNRLPQEITNDIVRLLSNSAEALQDFAYIKTQQDVNQFNIKYGVNLVLPHGL